MLQPGDLLELSDHAVESRATKKKKHFGAGKAYDAAAIGTHALRSRNSLHRG